LEGTHRSTDSGVRKPPLPSPTATTTTVVFEQVLRSQTAHYTPTFQVLTAFRQVPKITWASRSFPAPFRDLTSVRPRVLFLSSAPSWISLLFARHLPLFYSAFRLSPLTPRVLGLISLCFFCFSCFGTESYHKPPSRTTRLFSLQKKVTNIGFLQREAH